MRTISDSGVSEANSGRDLRRWALLAALGSLLLTSLLVACGEAEPQASCKGHKVVGKAKLQPNSGTMALSPPSACVGNPCDPFCQNFDEKPDGGVQADAQTGYQWPTGSVDDLPTGLVNKGLKEPCVTGADCQFNRYCEEPKTSTSCGHSKCQTGGGLTASCDACVDVVCQADPSCCNSAYSHNCSHDPCIQGQALKGNCDPCVKKVCQADPYCCSKYGYWDSLCTAEVGSVCGLSCPLGQQGNWTQSCVDKVATLCDAQCGAGTPPPESGQCVPWLPGETDPTCSGVDLALGVPCDDKIPVCNHGNTAAPAGVRLIHYPANSKQYPLCTPSQTHPQMKECFTTEVVPPGECRSVSCPNLGNGNREVMVNPPGAAQISECSCLDNWTLFSGGVSCGGPNCAGKTETAQFRPVNLYFVVDRSGSMTGSKWTGTTQALTSFFQSPSAGGLGSGLEFFPLSGGGAYGDGCAPDWNSCSAVPCGNPMIPVGKLSTASAPTDAQEAALVSAVNSVWPGGGTPTHPALDGALNWAVSQQQLNPSEIYVVVLVTDGAPTWCNTSNSAIANLAATAMSSAGVRTYTIGMQGANVAALDSIANAGGTGQAFVIQGTNQNSVEQQLTAAFNAIAGQNLGCSFSLPKSGSFDLSDVTVSYTPSSGSPKTALAKQNASGSCGDGWHFDDNLNPTKITLCPSTCATAQQDPGSKVEFTVGCPKVYGASSQSETYEAVCPPGTMPQWGFLAYDTLTPGDSEVVFSVRAATSQAGLATASPQVVATARSTPTDTQLCGLGGPAPCPIDLFTVLGKPAATYDFLQLDMTLTPSSGGTNTPTIHDWKITYSCPPSE